MRDQIETVQQGSKNGYFDSVPERTPQEYVYTLRSVCAIADRGVAKSDLLVINKIDLAPYVGASLEVMDRDAKKMRGARPFVFSNLKKGAGLAEIEGFIIKQGMLA